MTWIAVGLFCALALLGVGIVGVLLAIGGAQLDLGVPR
jgi:hypothetical protein